LVQNAIFYVTNCTFYNTTTTLSDSSPGYGGGIYMESSDALSIDVQFKNCIFDYILSKSNGGAFYVDFGKSDSQITIDSCNFTNVLSARGSLINAIFVK
jgi:hypothetical protein